MIIVNTIENYTTDCVFFLEPIKNNIIQNGSFIRILYSTELISLNGIHINLDFRFAFIEKYYNKIKCSYDIEQNKTFVLLLKTMEINLLNKINIKNKIPQYRLYDQIKTGSIKIYDDTYVTINFIVLKIAGICETDTHYGLTYKFYKN